MQTKYSPGGRAPDQNAADFLLGVTDAINGIDANSAVSPFVAPTEIPIGHDAADASDQPDAGAPADTGTTSDLGDDQTGGIVVSPETVTLPGSQLVFVNTYSASVTDAYRTAILFAEHELQSHFSNNVTITVSFGFADLSGFLAQNSFHNTVHASYANLRAALQSHATTADDIAAVNSLPASDPSNGTGYLIGGGMARLLGLPGAGTSSSPDVQLVLGNGFTWNFDPNNRGAANGYDAIGAIEHEITEGGFGRVGGLGYQNHTWAPMDLFRYSSPGQRLHWRPGWATDVFFGQRDRTTHSLPQFGEHQRRFRRSRSRRLEHRRGLLWIWRQGRYRRALLGGFARPGYLGLDADRRDPAATRR
jgi:hypothetical protein